MLTIIRKKKTMKQTNKQIENKSSNFLHLHIVNHPRCKRYVTLKSKAKKERKKKNYKKNKKCLYFS